MSLDYLFERPEPKAAVAAEESGELLTPPHILAALRPFDLDPCAPAKRPWDMAARHLTADGLISDWEGRVWLHPPSSDLDRWIRRLADHGQGTALLQARCESTVWHRHVWPRATGIMFLRGRLPLYDELGKPGVRNIAGALVTYGETDALVLQQSQLVGCFVRLR